MSIFYFCKHKSKCWKIPLVPFSCMICSFMQQIHGSIGIQSVLTSMIFQTCFSRLQWNQGYSQHWLFQTTSSIQPAQQSNQLESELSLQRCSKKPNTSPKHSLFESLYSKFQDSNLDMYVNSRSTSLAPPCRGPYRAPVAPASAVYTSTPLQHLCPELSKGWLLNALLSQPTCVTILIYPQKQRLDVPLEN